MENNKVVSDILIFICVICFTSSVVQCQNELDFLMNMLHKPRTPERIKRQTNINGIQSVEVSTYSWTDCGSTSDLAQIHSLNLSPDPLDIPGNVTVSASGILQSDLLEPIALDLEIKKKMYFWITVPCLDDVGSCTYDDICSMVKTFRCPPEFPKYGIPCQCPVKAGSYNLPPTVIPVDPVGIPHWATSGDYKITAKASYKGQQVLCLNLEISMN